MAAVEGDNNVTLTMEVDPSVDLMKGRVDVKRDDLKNVTVHSFRHGRDHLDIQSPQYKNRTTFFCYLKGKRVVGVILSNVTLNDGGLYSFYVPGLGAPCTINLTVAAKTEGPAKDAGDPENFPPWAIALVCVIPLLVAAGVLLCCWRSGRFKNCGGSGADQDIEMEPTSTTGGEGVVQNGYAPVSAQD
ncbi:uncharacterized protein LOC117815711 isoform X4 [Notolabrus celidotus]|nr:uncharacterized protein LOC117815711 isoform X4 [Notolabrus celidotus]